MLDNAADVLRWAGHGAFASTLYAGTVERLSAAYTVALARLSGADPARGAALGRRLDQSGPEAFLRVLTAPATFARLAAGPRGDEELWRFAEASLWAERCLDGGRTPPPHELWTALGDYRFSNARPASRRRRVAPQRRRTNHRVAPSYRAPRIDGIPVDFCSPQASGPDVPVTGPAGEVDRAWARRVLADLEAAVAGVRAMNGPALSIIRHFTRVIIARADPEHAGMFLSSSSPRYLGQSVLCNPESATVEELAEALLHEAIHGLLCSVQIQQPFVTDHARLQRLRVASPWTGKVLPMDAFVEACFVWYGLSRFWRLGVGGTSFRPAKAATLEQRARSGFLKGPLAASLAPGRAALARDVLDVISTLQRQVKAS